MTHHVRWMLAAAIAACSLLSTAVQAQAQAKPPAPAPAAAQPKGNDLLLGITEGSSGGIDHSQVLAKYGGLANVLGNALKRKVVVIYLREYAQIEEGMKSGRLDLLMGRPADFMARGVRNYGYRYVSHANPDGHCTFIAPKNTTLKDIKAARGKRWALPEEVSYMTQFCRAELRDLGIDMKKEKVTYVREQALIGSYVETGFVDLAGAASFSSMIKEWKKAGKTVLFESRGQPYFPMIAGKRINAQQLAAIQKQLMEIESAPGGSDVLHSIGITGFNTDGEKKLADLLVWLEKK